jgi:hypothetical protein
MLLLLSHCLVYAVAAPLLAGVCYCCSLSLAGVCCCCSLSLAGVCCCCFHIGWGMLLLLSHWLGYAAAALSLAGVCCCCFHIGWGMLLLLSLWLGYAAAALSLAGVCCCCFDIGWGMLLLLSVSLFLLSHSARSSSCHAFLVSLHLWLFVAFASQLSLVSATCEQSIAISQQSISMVCPPA